MAPFTDNPNAPNKKGDTPIYLAACNGHTEIVKILVPLADHLNVLSSTGDTAIQRAAMQGYTEIVQILAPFTDKANAETLSKQSYDLPVDHQALLKPYGLEFFWLQSNA